MIIEEFLESTTENIFLVDNYFIANGVKSVLREVTLHNGNPFYYVFFTEDNYFEAKYLSTIFKEHLFVMIYSLNKMDFLDSGFIHVKINDRIPLKEWLNILSMEHQCHENGLSLYKNILTPRECKLLDMYLKGQAMSVISKEIGTKLKHTYTCKYFIFEKLSCSHTLDFQRLNTVSSFRRWFDNYFKAINT